MGWLFRYGKGSERGLMARLGGLAMKGRGLVARRCGSEGEGQAEPEGGDTEGKHSAKAAHYPQTSRAPAAGPVLRSLHQLQHRTLAYTSIHLIPLRR